jgi:hypothetical protein
LKPLGQLEPNLVGMFIGWSSWKFNFLLIQSIQNNQEAQRCQKENWLFLVFFSEILRIKWKRKRNVTLNDKQVQTNLTPSIKQWLVLCDHNFSFHAQYISYQLTLYLATDVSLFQCSLEISQKTGWTVIKDEISLVATL